MTTSTASFQASALSNSLTVHDMQKSVAWYRDVVGFDVGQQHERDGKVVATAVTAGNVRLMLNQDDGGKGWDRAKGHGFSLYFTTDQSVDDLAARVKAKGSALELEPTDMPWGVRLVTLRDPDGYKINIAKPLA